jgi:uncharacterized membrane protein YfcA
MMAMGFELVVLVAAVLAGAIAAISGFGIGSVLTPLLATQMETKLAVAAVSIPHLVATAVRFVSLRKHLDRRVFWNFGLLSAAGGLAGALLNTYAASRALTIVFGCLLLLAGVTGLTQFWSRMRFGRPVAWIAGAASGLFGGLVGNQGGIRSAALLGFDVPKEAYVATATAIALIVDGARMPVYLATQTHALGRLWPAITIACAGVLVGTWFGMRGLRAMPERTFRTSVSLLIAALGVYMVLKGWGVVP